MQLRLSGDIGELRQQSVDSRIRVVYLGRHQSKHYVCGGMSAAALLLHSIADEALVIQQTDVFSLTQYVKHLKHLKHFIKVKN